MRFLLLEKLQDNLTRITELESKFGDLEKLVYSEPVNDDSLRKGLVKDLQDTFRELSKEYQIRSKLYFELSQIS